MWWILLEYAVEQQIQIDLLVIKPPAMQFMMVIVHKVTFEERTEMMQSNPAVSAIG